MHNNGRIRFSVLPAVILIILLTAAVIVMNGGRNRGIMRAAPGHETNETGKEEESEMSFEVTKTNQEWKNILTDDEFRVLRGKGTEKPFTGDLLDVHEPGTFICTACENELFTTEQKFNSGTGWPSFHKPIDENAVVERPDNSLGMERTEVLCARCGGHLGHVFNDGPGQTGLRYCMNSAAMDFEKEDQQ